MTICEACKMAEGIVDVTLGRYTGKKVCVRCFCKPGEYMEGEIMTKEKEGEEIG